MLLKGAARESTERQKVFATLSVTFSLQLFVIFNA